jgi:hypothetical protein
VCRSPSSATSSALQAAIPEGTGGIGLNHARRMLRILSVTSCQLPVSSFQFLVSGATETGNW